MYSVRIQRDATKVYGFMCSFRVLDLVFGWRLRRPAAGIRYATGIEKSGTLLNNGSYIKW